VILLVGLTIVPATVDTETPPMRLDAVYLPMQGPGGGGGGNPSPASSPTVEVPHHAQPRPVPMAPTPVVAQPPTEPSLDVAIETNAAGILRAAGTSGVTLGPGGGGRGSGAGPGNGPGVGPGNDGNVGGGARQPGGGVTAPTLIRSVDPRYTPGALVAKITGVVELDAVVLANGTVGEVRVVKSLDRQHGLDQEAVKAARQWLFRPGTAQGVPVDVIVRLIIEFHLR
jgi:protein TonB